MDQNISKKLRVFNLRVAGILCLGLLMILSVSTTLAAPNRLLNYQARITNSSGKNVSDGSYSIVFKIYSVSSGGTALWTESSNVNIEDGILDVRLGNSTPINLDFNTGAYYLGVTIEDDSELSPRRPIGAAPFALNSLLLDGRPVGTGPNDVLALDGGSNLNLPNNLTADGNATIDGDTSIGGDATVDGLLSSDSVSTGYITLDTTSISGSDGRIRFTGTDFEGYYGGTWYSLTAGGTGTTINGTPTPGQVVVVDASSDPTFTTITGDVSFSSTGVTTINANAVALGSNTTGDYVAGILGGSGITISGSGGEGSTPTVAIGPLTSNWNQTGAFDIVLANASSELKILESTGGTFYGTIDVGDLSADRTYTLPNESGTVCTTGSVCSGYAPASGSTVYATRQLDNLTGVAINADLLPDTDDTYDLGSDTLRWQDIYLGPATMHIGTSTADEGTLSYDTTNNELEVALSGTQQFMITGTGNVVQGTGALSTSATTGFPYIPTTAGVPTGVPTTYSGRSPFVFNTASNILYYYNSGWQAINGGGGGITGSGTAGRVTIWTGASAVGDDSTFLWNSTDDRLSLGATPSTDTAAILNIPNNQAISARNAANTSNVDLIRLTNTDAIKFGSDSTSALTFDISSGGASDRLLEIENSYLGQVNVGIEGYLEVHEANGLSGNVAQSGAIRLPNLEGVFARNFAGTADINLIQLTTADAIKFGSDSTSALTFDISSGGASDRLLEIENSYLGQVNVGIEGYLEVHEANGLGGNVAQSGAIRIGNADGLVSRNAANSADIILMQLTTTDNIQIGNSDTTTVTIDIPSGGALDKTLEFTNSFLGELNLAIEGDFQIGGNFTPDANDANDLGSDSMRWRDLYLGPGTMHIGTSTADEGTLSYDTTNNELEVALSGTQQFMVTVNGNVVQGNAAISTSATDGFPYIASMAGTPTGTPTTYTGRVPMTYDTSGNKFYIYDSGWQALSGSSSTLQEAYDSGNTITTTTARDIDITLADTATDSDFTIDMLGTGNVIEFQDSGTAFARWSDTGTTLFKPTTNSATALQVQPSASTTPTLDVDTTNLRIGINVAAPTATLDVTTTATSGASGVTRGWLQVRSATYTDNATAASGTAASFAFNGLQTPTLAATNTSVTTTNAATLYIAAQPTAGTNMTITNAWALWVDSGNSRFDGSVVPGSDNGVDLGTSALRWRDLYAGTSLRVGSTVASAGAIRLPNNTGYINWRNAGNSDDHSIFFDSSDRFAFGSTTAATTTFATRTGANSELAWQFLNTGTSEMNLDIEGSLKVYDSNSFGSNIASTGAIRLPNNTGYINWRNAGNSDDHSIFFDSSDRFAFGSTTAATTTFATRTGANSELAWQFLNTGTSEMNLDIEGSLKVYDSNNFGSNIASTGAIRLANNSAIIARNAGNTIDVTILSLSSSDIANIGAPLFVDPTGTQTGSPVTHTGFFRVDAATFQDTATAASGTATQMLFNVFERPTLTATNTSVTTTNAATLYVENSPLASTNQTITNAWALWVDSGNSRFDGHIYTGTNDTYDLGSDALRWRDIYLGPGTMHIGTSTSDEGSINYDTTSNELEFAMNGTQRLLLSSAGSLVLGTAAISTSATDGFLYIPSMAGAPTGTPTTYTGRVPITYNSTSDKIYIYDGGAWQKLNSTKNVDEDIRVLRGTVTTGTCAIAAGTGFGSVASGPASCAIAFSSAFAGAITVTATTESAGPGADVSVNIFTSSTAGFGLESLVAGAPTPGLKVHFEVTGP